MNDRPPSRRRLALALVVLLIAAIAGGFLFWQRRAPNVPAVTSPDYKAIVSAFYVGLAALEVGDSRRAEARLQEVTKLAPQEPAGWANLGLLELRANNDQAAAEHLGKARRLAPQNAHLEMLLGLLESRRGNSAAAIEHLRHAAELDAANLRACYALAQEIERQGSPGGDDEVARRLDEILKAAPDNLAARLEKARLAAKRSDAAALRATVASIRPGPDWTPDALEQLKALQTAAAGPNPKAAGVRVAFLSNVLKPLPSYRASLAALATPAGEVGEPLRRFIVLPSPPAQAAPPDLETTFTKSPLPGAPPGAWEPHVLWLSSEAKPAVFLSGSTTIVQVGSPLRLPALGLLNDIAGLDWNYDFKTDIVLTGSGGLRLFQQGANGTFADVTARAALPAAVLQGQYFGAWAADLEADGDLDLVLGAPYDSKVVLRNNGDGTFKPLSTFATKDPLCDSAQGVFAWADFDDDGDDDAAMVAGNRQLSFFTNERGGQFKARPVPTTLTDVAGLAVADINSDGVLDLLVARGDGSVWRLSDKDEGKAWDVAQLIPKDTAGKRASGPVRLFAVDLDNNGSCDIVASQNGVTQMWLSDGAGQLTPLPPLPVTVTDVADLTGDGRLDMVGQDSSTPAFTPVLLTNKGSKNYHWQDVRPRAQQTEGDQRINSFGIGGEIAVRAGLLAQKQPIAAPLVHFGLGEQTAADVARIVWPNGQVQAEFELKPDQAVLAEQRLTGSCPFLFAWDGHAMHFVKDCNWRSPLGLKINAQDTAGVVQTEDWVKVRGDQLAPRDGGYDLNVTADLWEAHFFDTVALLAVDHPPDTDIWVDERFSIPMPPLAVQTTEHPQPVARAVDDRGHDVTDLVRDVDGRYLDTFGRGPYQGVTRDHWVEIDLNDAPRDKPLWLLGEGWLHPTDSSINVALGQGQHAPPQALRLEVADGRGGWAVARPGLGFPSGKNKTILVDLNGVFRANAPRRVRLRTNLEIYWDRLAWAVARPGARLHKQRLLPESAQLRYRGFSEVKAANPSSPELPHYDTLLGTAPRWRDLAGFYTRFGDVRELLAKVDDRYVIMNAGDEMALRFAAPPVPPAGWARDFVFITDGWTKDGNLNTGFSKTVLPLPAHDLPAYTTPPGRLADDPVYRRHAPDWQTYHTRYIAPERFGARLWEHN